MPAIKPKWFIKNYLKFVRTTIIFFGKKLNDGSIPYTSVDDLKNWLLSDEIVDEIKKSISKKTIGDNAPLRILGDEMKMASETIEDDILFKLDKGKILQHILQMEDDKATSRIPLLAKMPKEILGSILSIFSDLPSWAKNSIKALSEIVEIFSLDARLKAITQKKISKK